MSSQQQSQNRRRVLARQSFVFLAERFGLDPESNGELLKGFIGVM